MANDQWEARKRGKKTQELPDWLTPFERLVCDPKNDCGLGFTKAALAENGVSWPPKKGWRSTLKVQILKRGGPREQLPNDTESTRVASHSAAATQTKRTSTSVRDHRRRTAVTSYEQDRKNLDLAGFAKTTSLRVKAGSSGCVVVEQSGFFVLPTSSQNRTFASRYIVFEKKAVPDLIKQLRELPKTTEIKKDLPVYSVMTIGQMSFGT